MAALLIAYTLRQGFTPFRMVPAALWRQACHKHARSSRLALGQNPLGHIDSVIA